VASGVQKNSVKKREGEKNAKPKKEKLIQKTKQRDRQDKINDRSRSTGVLFQNKQPQKEKRWGKPSSKGEKEEDGNKGGRKMNQQKRVHLG